jgi:hypothetical protein
MYGCRSIRLAIVVKFTTLWIEYGGPVMLKEEYKAINSDYADYEGFSFTENNFSQYLRDKVKTKFEDREWSGILVEAAVNETGFSPENFVEIFHNRDQINSWRIGELVAECILEDLYNVRFYYNSTRDSKNHRSNLPGADLVGFCNMDDKVCFLFGEVKTSNDIRTPPHVLYGKSGMILQLETLKDNRIKRHDLVKWIFSKAVYIKGDFLQECSQALTTYIKSHYNRVRLIGILVRDTEPNERDVKARARALSNIPLEMRVKLISLYTGLLMEDNGWERAMNGGV